MIMNKTVRDGHIHSPFCPHGTKDSLEAYIHQALKAGLSEMTFTEHMPLPDGVLPADVQQACVMSKEQVSLYFKAIDEMKEKYKEKIHIYKGMEVDYVEDCEQKTKALLDLYGKELEDGILSVHILKMGGRYYCVDMHPDEFGKLVRLAGGLEELYDLYFETLLKAIRADLGRYKPKRIGHPTLVRIFNVQYPIDYQNVRLLEAVVKEIKKRSYQIDYNTAGLRKPLCKEIYPSGLFLELAKRYELDIVYGSDAHSAQDVASGFK